MGEDHEDYCLQEYTYQFSPELLRGQVAFITGGGSGIGFRIAELFMRHGCDTVIASRNATRLEEAARRLKEATGRQCLTCPIDVRKYDQVSEAVKTALNSFQKIDILVNSAAGNFLCPAASLSSNGFKTVMDIDAIGTFNATKAVYEHYFKDHGGVVINITATLHYAGAAMQTHAGAAKAAIDAMTKHLAVEWGPQKIRVNGIAPGPIEGTEGMRKLGGASNTAREFLRQQIPLQALGTRTNVAEAALFLVCPLSSYVTGAVLVVDGGHWMTTGFSPSMLAKLQSKL